MNRTHTNADMSHQHTLGYKISELIESVRVYGLSKTIEKIIRRITYRLKGIDFETENIYNLTRTGAYVEHGTALVSTSYDFFMRVMGDMERFLGHPVSKELFIDYGSGKGGAIIHARMYGFKEAIGVEFAKELHETAQRNIERLKLDHIHSHYADATQFPPPERTSLIYLFNPFDAVVMERVADLIVATKPRFVQPVYLIYGNPSCEEVLDARFVRIHEVSYPTGARVLYYRV